MSGLTEKEEKLRDLLLARQKNKDRWFSQEEFGRLKELNIKKFKGAIDNTLEKQNLKGV